MRRRAPVILVLDAAPKPYAESIQLRFPIGYWLRANLLRALSVPNIEAMEARSKSRPICPIKKSK